VRAGTSYLDVGTLNGYRAAMLLLRPGEAVVASNAEEGLRVY